MVTKECLKRIIWILLSAVFLVGCYDDGNYITEEETIESESLFYYESEEVSLSMVLSLFDITPPPRCEPCGGGEVSGGPDCPAGR